MRILLTDEEILWVWKECDVGLTWGGYAKALNKAQLRKIKDWGNELCPHILTQIMDGSESKKRKCDVCWEELFKEYE